MKVQLTGKVLKRFHRAAKNGKTYYSIVIEEPGNYPRPFEFSSEDATLFGPKDGFAAVGKTVTATAYLNGYAYAVSGAERYGITLRLHDLADGCAAASPDAEPAAADGVADDIPF